MKAILIKMNEVMSNLGAAAAAATKMKNYNEEYLYTQALNYDYELALAVEYLNSLTNNN